LSSSDQDAPSGAPTVTVLVVDDSSTVRLQARRTLVAAGYAVLEAVDGLDGLDKLASSQAVALILCDVNMPRMTGIEFIEALAKFGTPMPPVVMLTTEGHPKLIQRAKACGAKGWMMKPFKPDVLIAAAKRLIAA
jgi:two-component system chemotaxis response regulator CheY